MPHIDIKCFPRGLDDEKKQQIAAEVCEVLKKHLNATDDSLSVAISEIAPDNWQHDVYEPEIKAHFESLVKKPGYRY